MGLAWRAAGRTRWGAAPFLVAALIAAGLTGRFDRPRGYDVMVVSGGIVTLLGAAGAGRCLAERASHWPWVAAAALISAAGVWAGVPETGPALIGAGGLVGLAGATALTRSGWSPAAGVGAAAVLGWAALSGAAGRPWAALGGALCIGVAPWLAVVPRQGRWSRSPRLWLLGAHATLVILAARWIAVVPQAGWGRVTVVAGAGLVVAVATRWRA